MPKFDRLVRVHMRSVAMPAVPEFTALANAQKSYEKIGVKLDYASGMSMKVSKLWLLFLDASDGTCKWNQASDELRMLTALGGRSGVGPTDIVVYYVNQIRERDGGTLNGCAGHEPGKPTAVVAATGSPWTMGHEIGHVLLGPTFDPVHATDTKNLMYAPSAGITVNPPGFTAEQATTIRASKFAVKI